MKLFNSVSNSRSMRAVAVATSFALLTTFVAPLIAANIATPAVAQQDNRYSSNELVDAGHQFFGAAASGLATVIERAVEEHGLPNGYVLGEEASGALVAGLRYGEGKLFTKNAGDHPVFWQGPSVGWDFGGDGTEEVAEEEEDDEV